MAQARLAEFLKEHRQRIGDGGGGGDSARMTFGEAAAIHLRNLDDNVRIKPKTRLYWRQRLVALRKSWREKTWKKRRFAGSRPPTAKTGSARTAKKAAPSSVNNTLIILRHIFSVAIEAGVIYSKSGSGFEKHATARERGPAALYRQFQCADCGDAISPRRQFS